MSGSERADLEARIKELEAELARLQAECDRLQNELAARAAVRDSGYDGAGGLVEGTLFISEIEVRSAVARQLRNVAKLLQAETCLYLLFDGQAELSAQRPALGISEEQLAAFKTTVNRGVSGEAFRTRKAILVADMAADELAGEEKLGEIGARNGICVPLMVQIRDEENRIIDTRPIGVLWVINRRGAAGFTEDDKRLLTVFARQVASVVASSKFWSDMMQVKRTLEQTIENLPAGIVFIGQDERIQLINGPARTLFSIPDSRGQGEPYYRVITHQDTCELLAATLREQTDRVAEVPFRVDEEERMYQIQAARVGGSDDDSLNGVVAIFDDVTEVHRVDQMKSEFVKTFSTELLGPLASIQGFSTMLQTVSPDTFGGEMRQEIHSVITGECQRLRRHIQDLLNVSRYEQGIRIHLNLSRIDIAEMLQRVADHEAAVARDHSVEIIADEPLPRPMADPARIEDVVFNLINNAFKYSPDGGKVTIRARASEDGGLRVEVQDQGVGIAREHHEQVFKQFTRLQSGDERVGHGRGVGLFVSKFFVESHGGQIGLTSEAGQGSTFWFTIPPHPPAETNN